MTCARSAAGLVVLLAALAISTARAGEGSRAQAACTRPVAPTGYVRSVHRALAARHDVWGQRLLSAPGGPTFSGTSRYLAPLLYAVGANGRPVTASGVYYLALAMPFSPYGSRDYALHVADGSEVVTRRVRGRHLTVLVGAGGRERFGSCVGRRGAAGLAEGYLPILQTSYVDAADVRYRQESFAARVSAVRSLVSFVHVSADARASRTGALVHLVSSAGGVRTARIAPGTRLDVYASWIDGQEAHPDPSSRTRRRTPGREPRLSASGAASSTGRPSSTSPSRAYSTRSGRFSSRSCR